MRDTSSTRSSRDEPVAAHTASRNLVDEETLAYNREHNHIGSYSFNAPLAHGLTGTALTVAAVRIGDHAHVHVESGNVIQDPTEKHVGPLTTRGFAGKLILRWHEWLLLRDTLAAAERFHVAEVENPTHGMAERYTKDKP